MSVGEVHRTRTGRRQPAFDSALIDQAQPGWAEFFAEQVLLPLWNRGWRAFFLDTLVSYHLVGKTAQARAQQEAGLIAVVRTLRQRFPGIKLSSTAASRFLPRCTARSTRSPPSRCTARTTTAPSGITK